MTRAAHAAYLLALSLLACSRTTDVYVGSDFDPPSSPGVAGAAPAGSGGSSAGTAGASGASAAAAGSAGAAVPPPSGVTPPSSPEPPPAATPEPPDPPEVQPVGCAAGTADCDADAANGCETDVTTDRLHCGACDIACATADCSCVDGQRVLACPLDRDDCDADPANGCETDLASDAQSCGSCGSLCSAAAPGVSSATCQNGTCRVTCQAPTLRGDCDGDPSNGCETDLFHDLNNCGTCGMQCNLCVDSRCL